MAELGIYNNSIIFEIDEDVQDLLIIDHYPQSNGNNSENEKQMIYFYLTLDQDNSTKYKMFIQSKKSRNLSEIFLYFNKKISKKIFNLISFFKFDILDKPTILNQINSLDELGIQNYNNILILIKQNVWIIDENPLITKEDSKYKFISKEQTNIIKIFIIYRFEIIVIQCSKERKLNEIYLYLEAIFEYGNEYIEFELDGKNLNQNITLSELGIKNGTHKGPHRFIYLSPHSRMSSSTAALS